MAIGLPRLVVHYIDGTLRLYELAAGVFTQIQSAGTYLHNPGNGHPDGVKFPPVLSFMNDSAYLMLVHSPSADDARARSFDLDLILKSSSANLCDINTGSAVGPLSVIPSHWTGELHAPVGTVRLGQNPSGNPGGYVNGFDTSIGADVGVRGLRHTPDGEYRIVTNKLSTALKASERTGYAGGSTIPLYANNKNVADLSSPITDGVWVTNTLFFGVGPSSAIVFLRNTTTQITTALLDVERPSGSPVTVVASPDQRFAAASFLDAGTYRTAVYTRRGSYLIRMGAIDNFGKLLAFTADGRMLVDAGLKKAYQRDGSNAWSEAVGVMANIADNADAAAVSTHVAKQTGVGRLYNNRLADIQNGAINLNDLYATILTSAAPAFDPTMTSATTAKGSGEVTAGGWPAGGYKLNGVAGAAVGVRDWKISANDFTHTLIPTGASWRSLLVYEKTTNKPVAFFDYGSDYSVSSSNNVTFSFASGLISFTE